MKKLSFIFAAAALLGAVIGCDKIDDPLKPYTPMGEGKTVLVKDFTGAMCVNCPGAAEIAHELQHQLGEDRVIIMGVHAGPLAQPAGQFPNFLTDEGTEWYGQHDSNPLFCVDNVGLTDGNTLYVEQIDTPVSDALAEPQSFELVNSAEYDESSRKVDVSVNAKAVSEYSGNLYVTVCLVEDSIVGWQKIPGGVDREYVFRHVFRGTLNGAEGDAFGNGQVYMDDSHEYNYSIQLDSTYNVDQCYILSYIYDKSKGGKILQTEMLKVWYSTP